MASFWADAVNAYYADVAGAKRWWIETFHCVEVPVPKFWDETPAGSVALRFAHAEEPSICLMPQSAKLDSYQSVPVIFTDQLKKAHELLTGRGVPTNPIQGDGSHDYFEIRDPENQVIEICADD